jgi:hypothetical protein
MNLGCKVWVAKSGSLILIRRNHSIRRRADSLFILITGNRIRTHEFDGMLRPCASARVGLGTSAPIAPPEDLLHKLTDENSIGFERHNILFR